MPSVWSYRQESPSVVAKAASEETAFNVNLNTVREQVVRFLLSVRLQHLHGTVTLTVYIEII